MNFRFIQSEMIRFYSIKSTVINAKSMFRGVASKMTHVKPIQTPISFAWVFG